MRTSPLEQFEMFPLMPRRLGTFDMSFTNSSLRRVLAVSLLVIGGYLLKADGSGQLMPGRYQSMGEGRYSMVLSRTQPLGEKGRGYFPFIFSLFTFILALNLMGLVPYSFTVTSHLIVTITLALAMWVGKLMMGIRLHGVQLLGRFLPGGAPRARAPRLVGMELISFVITMVSLSVRLFANRRAGHILLKVRAGFAWTRRLAGGMVYLGHFRPLMVLFLLLGLETGVARVQAYVFSLLTARYIGDRLDGGH